MTIKKTLGWAIAFSALTLFSLSAFAGLFQSDIKLALAQSLADQRLEAGDSVLVFTEDNGQTINTNWTNAFSNRVICAVNETQRLELAAQYDSSSYMLNVNGQDVNVVEISRAQDIKAKDIAAYVEATGSGQADCQVVQYRHSFFLLFSPSIS